MLEDASRIPDGLNLPSFEHTVQLLMASASGVGCLPSVGKE